MVSAFRRQRAGSRNEGTRQRTSAKLETAADNSTDEPPPSVILPELLSPKEFETKLKEGIKVQSSEIIGRTYVLRVGKRIKVLDKGKKKTTYLCVRTQIECKDEIEEYTALYLNLVLNEKGLLRVANVMTFNDYW